MFHTALFWNKIKFTFAANFFLKNENEKKMK